MKIRIDARVFEEMVSVAAQAISGKPMKPEHECVYVEACADGGIPAMTVIGRDVGIAIRRSTDNLTVEEEGETLIPAKTLLSFLKLMKGEVALSVDGNCKATMKCSGKRVSISCMGTEDGDPSFSLAGGGKDVTMHGDEFGRCVNSVSHCISTDQGKMVLTGVNFAFDGTSGKCEAVGMDNFRLALAKGNAETNDTFSALIPIATAKLIARVIAGSDNVNFTFGSGVVMVDDYTTSIQTSLLSGEYMDYRRMMMSDCLMRVKISIQALYDAVKLAMVSADSDKGKMIILAFSGDDIVRVSARADKCDAVSDIDCVIEGEMKGGETEIAFNGDYVLAALKAAQPYGDDATLMLKTTVSPMAVIPVGRDDYYQLVLPVRRN